MFIYSKDNKTTLTEQRDCAFDFNETARQTMRCQGSGRSLRILAPHRLSAERAKEIALWRDVLSRVPGKIVGVLHTFWILCAVIPGCEI